MANKKNEQKYVSPSKLSSFLENLKDIFAGTGHKHAISDVTNLQSELNNKASTSHGIHVSYSTVAPVMDGTANAGSAETIARSDHKHPTDTSRASQSDLNALKDSVSKKSDSNHGHSTASTLNDGFMSKDMVAKLNNIENNANNYTLPSAGASLGGVKTGGDVSIVAGEITVNDDSHNHVIGNIDGLQSTLDGKVPTSRTINGKALTANVSLSASDVGADSKGSADAALSSAKTYANQVKNDLLNGAGEAYDTLKELGDLIDDNKTAIDVLETVASNKSDKGHSHDLNAMINTLSTGSSAPTDADYYISQYAGGGTSTTTYHRRPMSALWTWIKNKADGIYQPKGSYETAGAAGSALSEAKAYTDKIASGKSNTSHTHKYASSATIGGSADSAVKLDSSAGSTTQPIFFKDGKPVATTYALNKTVPSDAKFSDTTYSNASTSSAGLMSIEDKIKIDGIDAGANKTTIDSALSDTSTNPVQNKVVNSKFNSLNTAINEKMDKVNPVGSGTFSFGREDSSTIGQRSVVLGSNATAAGKDSVVLGRKGKAISDYSTSIGYGNTVSGQNGVAIGVNSTVSSGNGISIGSGNTVSEWNSVAIGASVTSSGSNSVAMGASTKAGGLGSFASGYSTEATGGAQTVLGSYNVPDEAPTSETLKSENLVIVGNGDIDAETPTNSNAHTLDWDGNAWFAGDVYVGSTSGTNKDSGSKRLSTEEFVEETVDELFDEEVQTGLSTIAWDGDVGNRDYYTFSSDVTSTTTISEILCKMSSIVPTLDDILTKPTGYSLTLSLISKDGDTISEEDIIVNNEDSNFDVKNDSSGYISISYTGGNIIDSGGVYIVQYDGTDIGAGSDDCIIVDRGIYFSDIKISERSADTDKYARCYCSSFTLTDYNGLTIANGDGKKHLKEEYLSILEVPEAQNSSDSPDTITWDGSTDGKEFIDITSFASNEDIEFAAFCYMCECDISESDLQNGVSATMYAKGKQQTIKFEAGDTSWYSITDSGLIGLVEVFVIYVPVDNFTSSDLENITFPKKGIYFYKTSSKTDGDIYVSSFKLNEYDGFVIESQMQPKIKEEYLPLLTATNPDTATWDGTIDDENSIIIEQEDSSVFGLHRISSSIPTVDDLNRGFTVVIDYLGNKITLTQDDYTINSDDTTGVISAQCSDNNFATFVIVPEDNLVVEDISISKRGVYVILFRESGIGLFISSFSINGYSEFGGNKLKKSYLPTHEHSLGDISGLATIMENIDTNISAKANKADLTSHVNNKSNPHGVTLGQLGLSVTKTELGYLSGATSSIQKQLDNKTNVTLLWENTSYSDDFPAQNVTIDNLSNYQFIIAFCNYSTTTSNQTISAVIPFGQTYRMFHISNISSEDYVPLFVARDIVVGQTDNVINFGSCMSKNNTTTTKNTDSRLIPRKIYGVSGILG